jgi:hypothetical protein
MDLSARSEGQLATRHSSQGCRFATRRRNLQCGPDLQSGHRTFIRELAPADRTGVSLIFPISIIGDGRGYAYFYVRDVATWYVVQDTGHGR